MALAFSEQKGRGPALVCVHGAAGNRHIYGALMAEMPEQHVIAIDMPGRPETGGAPPTDVSHVADAVSALAAAHITGPYVVAGHSVGGGVAIELALRGEVAGAVLIATGARLRVHPTILALFEEATKANQTLADLPRIPGLWEGPTPEQLSQDMKEKLAATPMATALADWRMANRFDRLHDVQDIALPTLVVSGTEDVLTPEKYGRYLASQIPNAELHMVEGAGHALHIERADALAAVIRTFLDALAERTPVTA